MEKCWLIWVGEFEGEGRLGREVDRVIEEVVLEEEEEKDESEDEDVVIWIFALILSQ